MAHYINSFPGRTITVNEREYLYFGGTSYLGLQTDTNFQNIFIENIKRYGTNYGASRKSNVRISLFDDVENYLKNLVGSESCITLSSGYLAGQLVAQTLDTKDFQFFYAPNSHAAMHRTKKRPFTTFTALNIAIREYLSSKKDTSVPVVFVDSIDFSGCNYPDFEALKTLPLDQIILVVDDSHGIGIVGENGSGIFKILSKLPIMELLVCCSLGKGFGIQAGAIFGTKNRITQLSNTPFYGGASPAAPAALSTIMDAQNLYGQKRDMLQNNIAFFLTENRNLKKFNFMKNHPAFSFGDNTLTTALEKEGILLTNFPYPDEDASLMSRIVLSAIHKKKDIVQLSNCLNTLL